MLSTLKTPSLTVQLQSQGQGLAQRFRQFQKEQRKNMPTKNNPSLKNKKQVKWSGKKTTEKTRG